MTRAAALRLLAAVAVVSAVAELLAYDRAAGLLAAAFGTAVAAVLLLVVLPRVDPRAHGLLSVSFGASALFTAIAFWSALSFAFAAGAVAARGRAGAVLGLLGAALAFAFCIIA